MEGPVATAVEPAVSREVDESGVDRTLIRWMLELTPAERLEVLQQFVDQAEELRIEGRPIR